MKNKGFTLAEVLITLGIIGIVATLTMPSLMQSYKKRVVETRMAKFYSTFNQALKMSETVNGSMNNWNLDVAGDDKDAVKAWQDKFITPYVKTVQTKTLKIGDLGYRNVMYLPDGSLVITCTYSSWLFFPQAKDFEMKYYESSDSYYPEIKDGGKKWFTFELNIDKRSLEPWYWYGNWDGTIDGIKNNSDQGCNPSLSNEHALCARWIQMNGWKIPKDYPFKF